MAPIESLGHRVQQLAHGAGELLHPLVADQRPHLLEPDQQRAVLLAVETNPQSLWQSHRNGRLAHLRHRSALAL